MKATAPQLVSAPPVSTRSIRPPTTSSVSARRGTDASTPASYSGGSPDQGLRRYCREIAETPLLTRAQEVKLAARIKRGDEKARSHMIKANLRLVVKIAQDYSNLGLPLGDLISEGNIGLMKAVERFDPKKGGKLSTYAAWWIKQCMKRALANQGRTIRLPVHMKEKISKMNRIAGHLTEELGREPSVEEISEFTGIPTHKLTALMEAAMRPASLDAPMGEDDSRMTFGETVKDDAIVSPDDTTSGADMVEQLGELLGELDERERRIIDLRFGLGGRRSRTLVEVGKEFGVTRERIRQLQNVALTKMRRALSRMEDPRFQRVRDIIERVADNEKAFTRS
ncbi:RNA polymerase sigma factor RpoD/SigA [Verrucomicrobiales bacterium]|nr:RNA polymerase sigma factor RpoD/SigA [Verrucomicrobiales bacterium]MDF1789709.1 RNA polymerase sigma factor RpoD/SigA [Verrucomicrobiales bacterium]